MPGTNAPKLAGVPIVSDSVAGTVPVTVPLLLVLWKNDVGFSVGGPCR